MTPHGFREAALPLHVVDDKAQSAGTSCSVRMSAVTSSPLSLATCTRRLPTPSDAPRARVFKPSPSTVWRQ